MSIEAWALLIGIGTAVFAVAVSSVAILRAFIPPQTREVRALRASVEELADDNDALHGRLNERAARANMEKAREARDQGKAARAQQADLVEEARRVVASSPAATPPAASGADVEATRAALRRRFIQ